MPEKCLLDKPNFSSLLLSDLLIICSFVLSQPIYFLYIAFFSPYLLRIFSFLSPLFITTSLLIITLLTISPGLIDENFLATLSFLQTAYHALLLKLQPGVKINVKEHKEDESHSLEALQVYNFVFDTSMIDAGEYKVDDPDENPEERVLQTVESSVLKIPHQDQVLTIASGGDSENCFKCEKIHQPVKQEKSNGEFLKLLDYFESMKSSNVGEIKKVEPPPNRKINKAIEKQKQEPFVMKGYEAKCDNKVENDVGNAQRQSADADEKDNGRDYSSRSNTPLKYDSANADEKDNGRNYFSRSDTSTKYEGISVDEKDNGRDYSSRSDTSTKYESANAGKKDNGRDYFSWSNTSTKYDNANADEKDNGRDYTSGGDASTKYDLGKSGSARKEKLWNRTLACKLFEERHKVDGSEDMDSLWEAYEVNSMKEDCRSDQTKRRDRYKGKASYYEDDDNNEDDDDDEIVAQLCCLQAFKFSAGKMNLGVGKRNLARISKAVKGIGWLHKVSRHGKKVHNGDSPRFA